MEKKVEFVVNFQLLHRQTLVVRNGKGVFNTLDNAVGCVGVEGVGVCLGVKSSYFGYAKLPSKIRGKFGNFARKSTKSHEMTENPFKTAVARKQFHANRLQKSLDSFSGAVLNLKIEEKQMKQFRKPNQFRTQNL